MGITRRTNGEYCKFGKDCVRLIFLHFFNQIEIKSSTQDRITSTYMYINFSIILITIREETYFYGMPSYVQTKYQFIFNSNVAHVPAYRRNPACYHVLEDGRRCSQLRDETLGVTYRYALVTTKEQLGPPSCDNHINCKRCPHWACKPVLSTPLWVTRDSYKGRLHVKQAVGYKGA